MDASEVERLFRERLGLRLGPEMCRYVMREFEKAAARQVPVMAGEARTGKPVLQHVDLQAIFGGQPLPQGSVPPG